MARSLTDSNNDDVYEWSERVTDFHGDDLTVSLTLDAVDDGSGFSSDGRSSSNVSWLDFSVAENNLPGGTREEILNISAQKSGLQDGYQYQFKVTADDGVSYNSIQERTFTMEVTSDSPPEVQVDLTVQSSAVNSNLSNFPVYVDLSDSAFTSDFFDFADSGDIRVKDNSGNEVPREIVYFDKQNEEGVIYFQAPSLASGSNTSFKVIANNSSSPLAASDPNGRNEVWSNGFHRVYHFADDPSNGTALDSTGGSGANVVDDGGGAPTRNFGEATGSHWDIPESTYLEIPIDTSVIDTSADPFTIQSINATDSNPNTQDDVYIAINENGGSTIPIYYNNDGEVRSYDGGALNWYQWSVGRVDNQTLTHSSSEQTRGFLNGTEQASNSSYDFSTTISNMWSMWGESNVMQGRIHQWFISSVERSTEWVQARNENIRNTNNFYTLSS